MKDFIEQIKKKVTATQKIIVFPEAEDLRVLQAAAQIEKEGFARVILLGNYAVIQKMLVSHNIILKHSQFIDPSKTDKTKQYAELFLQLRSKKRHFGKKSGKHYLAKSKKLSFSDALALVQQPMYFAVMMLYTGEVAGVVAGSVKPKSVTLKSVFEIIATKERFHRVSGLFLMMLEDKLLFFADCAVQINPSSKELAEIAIDSAETAQMFGVKPKIAFLSFSTKGSNKDESLDRIRNAVVLAKKLAKKKGRNIIIDGEMQVDAALEKRVAKRKCADSPIQGDATVLIFPDLNSANIAYKLVERLAKANAIGPILQGLSKPVNDLSRGCSVSDIVAVAAITCYEAIVNDDKKK